MRTTALRLRGGVLPSGELRARQLHPRDEGLHVRPRAEHVALDLGEAHLRAPHPEVSSKLR